MPTAIPTARQLEYQDWEFGIFLHFGIRTFFEGHADWDNKPMPADKFNPTEFSADEWAKNAKDAGAKYMVLVTKHHDGFANWPSKFSNYSVAQSPWKNGKGDVVREYTDACAKYGLKVGLYYSPAEWGNDLFKSPEKYDEHFINQISEILGNYGNVDMLWFDGCGSGDHKYNWPRIMKKIRTLQPNILIFNMGGEPDYRWVGNEEGQAQLATRNSVSSLDFAMDKSEKEELGKLLWLPAECDFRIRHSNWFYSDNDEHTLKSPDDLLGLYYLSVGRGCNMLLNIAPDRRGLFPEKDKKSLLEFGAELRRRFSNPIKQKLGAKYGNNYVFNFPERTRFNHLVLQEDLTNGEHAVSFRVKIADSVTDTVIYEGRTIGHKAICQFPTVTTKRLMLEVATEKSEEFNLKSGEFFYVQ